MIILKRWHNGIFLGVMLVAMSFVLLTRSYFQVSLQDQQQISIEVPKTKLNAEHIKPFLFGFSPLVADLIWIYSVVEMDLQLKKPHDYNFYYMLVHLMTDLDPHFEPLYFYTAYQFMFGTQGTKRHMQGVDDAQEVLLKGWDFYINRTYEWTHYHRNWLIPQMIGFHYYFEYKDKEKALPYFEYIAHHVPQAPQLYRTFASHIYKELNQTDQMSLVLENILLQEILTDQMSLTENKGLKERIRERLINLQGGIDSKDQVDAFIEQIKQKSQSIVNIWLDEYPYLTLMQFLSIHPHVYREKLISDIDLLDILFYQGEI